MNRAVLFLFFPLLAFAADPSDLINGDFDATSRKERSEIARELLNYVENLSIYVTTPKPSEIEWLDAEQQAIAKLKETDAWSGRMAQLYDSPEFQHQKLYGLLDDIKTQLGCVIGEDTILRREILCWSITSLRLSDRTTFDDAITILKRHGKLPEDIPDGYGEFYGWYASGINEYIVIPYLRGSIRE